MEKEIKEKTNTKEENSTDKEKNVAKEKKLSKVKKNREKLIKENAKFSFIFEKGMSEAIKDFWKSKAGLITVACVFVICLITGIVLDNTSVSAFYVKPATENTNVDVNKPNEVANGGNGILGLGDKKDGIDDGRTTEEVMIDNYKSALEKYGVMSETYVFYPDQAENFKNLMRNFENSLNARKYDECDTISAEIGEMMKTVMASNREIIGNLLNSIISLKRDDIPKAMAAYFADKAMYISLAINEPDDIYYGDFKKAYVDMSSIKEQYEKADYQIGCALTQVGSYVNGNDFYIFYSLRDLSSGKLEVIESGIDNSFFCISANNDKNYFYTDKFDFMMHKEAYDFVKSNAVRLENFDMSKVACAIKFNLDDVYKNKLVFLSDNEDRFKSQPDIGEERLYKIYASVCFEFNGKKCRTDGDIDIK